MAGDKRIVELPRSSATAKDGAIAIVDPIADQTQQIKIQESLGAVRADMDWQSDATYSTGDLVLYLGLTCWQSLQDNNTGNIPAENAFWTEQPISKADGITDTVWSSGIFTYNDSKVVYNNAQYYLQVAAPYSSTDIVSEIAAGDWGTPGVSAVDFLDFIAQGSAPTYQAGRMWFDGVSFNLYDNIPGTSLQVAKEIVLDGRNGNSITLDNLTVVDYDTATGGIINIDRAIADSVINAESIGLTTQSINVGDTGKVVTQGEAGGDLSAFNVDDLLFLSATVPGGKTNLEQEILKPIGRVLIADTEANGGKMYVFQRPIINITAIGQAAGLNELQVITAVPEKFYGFDADKYELNVDVTQTQNPVGGEDGYDAVISPTSVGATGFYLVSFSITLTGSANAQHIVELYINGSPTGFLGIVDISNNNIDSGTLTIVGTATQKISNTDTLELYCYTDGGSSTVVWESSLFEISRQGNV